jgi:hypothetical protein
LAGLSAKGTIAILFPILPMPNILPSIRPEKGTKTLLLIFQVFSIVAATIRPGELSPAIHLIISPCPRVLSPIRPAVPTLTLYVILKELAIELGTIGPDENTVTMFFAHAVVSLILGTVRPIFFAFSILCVLCPIPFV